jgi:hypothetical protein
MADLRPARQQPLRDVDGTGAGNAGRFVEVEDSWEHEANIANGQWTIENRMNNDQISMTNQ